MAYTGEIITGKSTGNITHLSCEVILSSTKTWVATNRKKKN